MKRKKSIVVAAAAGLALAAVALSLALSFLSAAKEGPAAVWTDVPELALYAELFNASQGRYRVEVEWKADLPSSIRDSKAQPALAVGRYLKSQAVRDRFQSLDYLFGELLVNQAAFYPVLLSLGNVEGRQLLLPLSFNLPTIVFAAGGEAKAADDFTIGVEELKAAAAYNRKKGSSYDRMGFSPRWDGEFLTTLVNSGGASFKEGRPLAWSDQGLSAAVERARAWSESANGSRSAEEDFQFKYLYTPAYKYVAEGRALYAYLKSSDFFLVPEEKRSLLDYRWFAEGGAVPVDEAIVFAAMPRAGKGKAAAEAFLKWLYKEDSQKAALESARKTRSLEGSFGVAGGFSALRSVNERVFPLFYPALVGHLPPADGLSAPNVLPSDWPAIKEKVLKPWLLEATGRPPSARSPGQELQARLAEYLKNSGR
ncbi:MAG TPA: hypothetical protein PLG14_07845 [Spirochaetales bacterium]|nr:hypothetical protein [Spirochaetales bacterium]